MAARAETPLSEMPLPESTDVPETSVPVDTTVPPEDSNVVLDIRDLKTYFYTYDGVVKALDGVNLKIRKGQTTGLVGETGCGKSVTAFSVVRLIPDPPGRIIHGKVLFDGADVLWGLDKEATFAPIKGTNRVKISRSFRRIRRATERMAAIRGRGIAMIFQEPTQAMNPIFTISNQIAEALLLHRGIEIVDGLLRDDPGGSGSSGRARRHGVGGATGKVRRPQGRGRPTREGGGPLVSSARRPMPCSGRRGETTREPGPNVQNVLRGLHVSGLEHSYLAHRKRMIALNNSLDDVYMREMREGVAYNGERRRLRRRIAVERWSHLHFGLWGIRSRSRRALDRETFWRSVQLLEGVSIANPVQVARGFPHELSGGMLQRVMIAMALSAEPKILLADEPTTALDVTIQAQILELMRDLKTKAGTAILLITHDLAVIAEVADRVCVMYAGDDRGGGRGPRDLPPAAPPLHAGTARLDPATRPARPGAHVDPGVGPEPHLPALRLPIPPAVSVRDADLQGRAAARSPMEGTDHTVACYLYTGPRRAD